MHYNINAKLRNPVERRDCSMNKRKLLCKLGACTLAAALCVPFLAPTRANAASSRVEEILGNMTLKQKVEQMLMPDFRDW